MEAPILIDGPLEVPPPTGKLCPGCGRDFPHDQLEVVQGLPGIRRPLCPDCRQTAKEAMSDNQLEANARRRSKEAVRRVERFIGLARAKDDEAAPTINAMLVALMDEAGGVENFAATWWAQLQELVDSKQGKSTLLTSFSKIANLLLAATPRIEQEVDYRGMTDEQLEIRQRVAHQRTFAIQLVKEFPQMGPQIEDFMARHPLTIEEAEEDLESEVDDEPYDE